MLNFIIGLFIAALLVVTATYVSLPEATWLLQGFHANQPAVWLLAFMREQQFPLETYGPVLIIVLVLMTFIFLALGGSEVSKLKTRLEQEERRRDEAVEKQIATTAKLEKAEAEVARLKGPTPAALPPAPKLVVPKLVMPDLDIGGQLDFLQTEAARLEGRITEYLESNNDDNDWRVAIDALVAQVRAMTATVGVHRHHSRMGQALSEIERLVEASAAVDASVARVRGSNASETLDSIQDDTDTAQTAIEDAKRQSESAARLMSRVQEISGQLNNLEGDQGLFATVRQLERLSEKLKTRIENLPPTDNVGERLDKVGEDADKLEQEFDEKTTELDKLRVQITGLRTRLNAIATQIGFEEPVKTAAV